MILSVHPMTIKSIDFTKFETMRVDIELVVAIFNVFTCWSKLTHY